MPNLVLHLKLTIFVAKYIYFTILHIHTYNILIKILKKKTKTTSFNYIHGEVFDWISSFISNRFHAAISLYKNLSSGVLQGYHLGRILFLLYINDIGPCFLNSSFILLSEVSFKKIKYFFNNIVCMDAGRERNHYI